MMNLRIVTTALVLAALALSAGCASTSKVMLGQPRPAIAPEQVRVYYAPPPGRYVEIALLETASGGFTYGEQNKMDAVVGKLRAEAARLGANGVLFQGTGDEYSGSNVGIGVGGGHFGGHSHLGVGVGVNVSPTQLHARGVAIHVLDPPPAESAPPRSN